jgi:hypothetical protein
MAFHLISIGISNYSNPANNLSYPEDDASEISGIFRNSLGADIVLDILLRNNEASQIGIRTALNAPELKKASSTDTLILFYSGHGDIGKNSNSENEAYLAPYDAAGDIAISGISTTEVKNTLDSYKHGKKIILLDCCYSGGANAKSISRIKHKDLGALKAFQNQTFAEGTFVFTACKEDETAIEISDLKHGLFTYYLIEELVKDRQQPVIPLSDIHHPVDSAVKAAAKKYSHTQTPTLQQNTKGSMTIPKLSRPLALRPQIIKVPTISNEVAPVVSAPHIEITDKEAQELVDHTLKLIGDASHSKLNVIAFRSHLNKVLKIVQDAHEELPRQASTLDDLADYVALLEGKAYQLFVMTAAVGVAADEPTQKIFADDVADILLWKHGKAGLVAAIETSDIIFLVVLYILLVCSIYTADFGPVAKLLNTEVADWNSRDQYIRVVEEYGIHYADALGGNAQTVLTHLLNLLKTQKWLQELLGVDEKKLESLVLQANMCVVIATVHAGGHAYPAYNDHDISNLNKLVHQIRTDTEVQSALAPVLGVEPKDVPKTFATIVADLNTKSNGHWWYVLRPESFTENTSTVQD